MHRAAVTVSFLTTLFFYWIICQEDNLINIQQDTIKIQKSQIITYASENVSLKQRLLAFNKTFSGKIILKEPASQQDMLLKKNQWVCSLYGKKFIWSKAETQPGVNSIWLGAQRRCVRFDRLGTV
jgi:hypothetical protein